MTDGLVITDLSATDVDELAAAFADWPKPRSTFEGYASEAAERRRAVLIARLDGALAGFVTVNWNSAYSAFAAAGIPEIQDLNVLTDFQRRGIGTSLMNAAELCIARAGHRTVGIGVGLYAGDGYGYGSAQRMYVKRGYIPDGAGVMVDGVAPTPGTSIVLDESPVLMFTKSLA